ncbi:MAG: GNAT family N-acetyltransferase [Alphaproteobacteria bacterium]|nr:GNAT family N-acetyltransferase [Alphaproteobacteria bacterium]
MTTQAENRPQDGASSPANAGEEFGNVAKPRSVPARPLEREEFKLLHLAISRGQREARRSKIAQGDPPPAFLRMIRVTDATADDFLHHLQRVGAKYGWDRRRKYQDSNKPALEEMMRKPETRLYIFLVSNQPAGFCLITPIDGMPSLDHEQRQGLEKTAVIDEFKKKHRLTADSRAIEINKIGLYDEFTGKNYGDVFLEKIFTELFEKEGKYDIIYLDTRDTNHPGVPGFYRAHGMRLIRTEHLQSDLVPPETAPTWQPAPINRERVLIINGGPPKPWPADIPPPSPPDGPA